MNVVISDSQDEGATGDARSITRLYVVALAVIAALSIVGQLLVQRQLQQQRADATVINIAGRQRMLSQRLCKCVLMSAVPGSTDDDRQRARDELATLLPQWYRSHRGLRNGDAEMGLPGGLSPEVTETFARIEPSFDAMYGSARRLSVAEQLTPAEPSEEARNSAVAAVLANEAAFLDGMDAIVDRLEAEAQARVERLRAIELTLLLCTLLALACEGYFIFRPAVRRIRTTIAALRVTGRELREARDAADAANRAKSQFLANVSHELRTPLHAVRGAAELLLARMPYGTDREYLQIIDESSESLSALVDDLLDVSQIEVEGLKLTSHPFNLVNVLRRCGRIIGPVARKKSLDVQVKLIGNLPQRVVGDEFRLQQVLLNLLNNAVKFSETGGITLTAQPVDDSTRPLGVDPANSTVVRFEVVDTGIGIPPAEQERIFEKFSQVDQSPRRRAGGVGLGLSICSRLVNLMHARLRVESDVGKGSRFWFETTLPHATTDEPAEKNEPLELRPLRILAADDTDHSRQILSAMLGSLGHAATVVEDGAVAYRRFLIEPFDIVLLDGQMPEWDGERTASAMREQEALANAPRTPLIMLTADTTRRDDLPKSFDDCLIKPASRQALQAMIAKHASPADFPESSEPALGSNGALERLGGDESLYDDLLQTFFAGLPDQLQLLQAAVNEGSSQIGVIAHRLGGQLATFDFHDAHAAAADLEAHSSNAANASESFAILVDRLRELRYEPRKAALKSPAEIPSAD